MLAPNDKVKKRQYKKKIQARLRNPAARKSLHTTLHWGKEKKRDKKIK